MKCIDNYIIEKLKLRQGVQRSKSVFIIYYKKSGPDQYKEYVVIDDLNELKELRKDKLKNTYYRIFECPSKDLVDGFVQRWEKFNPFDDEDGLWGWSEKNGIKELRAEDVNNFFYPKK